MLDAFFYQDARPQGNFGRAFLLPLTGSDTPYRRCRDWGRDGLVCAEAKQKGCHRGRGRRHRAGGLKISGRPSEVPLPGGRQHRAGGPCCFTGPANFVGSPGAAGQTSPVFQCCGPLPSGRRPFFSPLLPLPVESRRKPLIACPSATERRPTGPCPLRRRKLRASTAERNGAALHSVVIPPNDSGKRPVAYLPAGRHFFKEYPHAPR